MRNIIKMVIIGLLGLCAAGVSAQTPPVQPKVQETPLPPPVELSLPAGVSSDVANKPLTADEAAAIALRRQPGVTIAQMNVVAAQGRRQQAQSGLLPTVSTGASYTNTAISPNVNGSSNSVGTATSPGYQVTANLRQLIFDFNHTRDLVREANALVSSAASNLSRVQSDLVYQVKQAFYTYSQNERLVSVNEANVRNQQSHLESARARLEGGLGLPADVVRAQTAVADAIFNLNVARNNVSTSRVALAQLMGIDPRTPIVASDTGEPPVKNDNLNDLVNLATTQRPEMLQALANARAAGYGLSAARTGDSPALSANAGWLQRGSNFPPENNSLTYGVAVQWTPFDSGLTRGRIKEAQANLKSQQAEVESARLTVSADVSQAYLDLKTAEQRAATADSEVANAQEALRLVEGRYQAGLGTFLDVLDAQTALITANTNRVNAQSAVDRARAAIEHSIGSWNVSAAKAK